MAFDLGELLKQANVSNLDTGREQITYLSPTVLDSDTENFYELRDIDALADNISVAGLQQPIRVRAGQEPGRYTIVSGHRRLAACRQLAEADPERWAEVPCIIETDSASPALQQLRLIYANANTRQLTSAEMSEQAQRVEKLLYELKNEGYEFPGRMRDHVAEAVGASQSKLARLKLIRERLNVHFTKLWESGQLRDSVAYTLAQASAEDQNLIWLYQTADGTKAFRCSEGWVQGLLREMTRVRELCGKTSCAVQRKGKCQHCVPRVQKAAGLSQYSALGCQGCCFDCWNLKNCQFSCAFAADTRAVQREKAKAEKRQEKAEQEAKEAPEREVIRQCYQRVGELRAARGISEEDFLRASLPYLIKKDVELLPKLEAGTVSLNDRLPGGLWPAEARRLGAVADLLGCSIDYLLGRTDTPEIVPNLGTTEEAGPLPENVPNLGTGWRTGDPDEPGTYAVIGEDPGSPTQMLERWDWDGKQWTVYGEPAKNYGFLAQCWIPLPPKIGTCITGMSGSGRCGAAAYCAEPVECCLQCDKDCNGRCGWIQEDET